MKLYDFPLSPSPRRARVFAAEKGIALETVTVNIREMEQFGDSFRKISPNCTVPVLELDDGTLLTDSFAIWRYLEEIQPEPPLMGRAPLEKAMVEQWLRRIELDGYQACVEAIRNGAERFKDRAVPSTVPFAQIPELAERGLKRVGMFFGVLDERLRASEYIAGPDYTAADIHAMITVDFAINGLQLSPPDGLAALKAWHEKVSARPSAKA
ncbi:MAG: glutathione S-transferase family protein [Alphaproteobacteria bacterium]|nr:glutathione S-transferase family protein [Alphaproteobacteria bacterium]